MKRELMFLFVGILLFTLVAAETQEDTINYIGEVAQYECKMIPQTCASCSYVNITIFRDNEILVDNQAMTQSGASWNYSYCNDGTLGDYYISGSGDLGGTATGFKALYFKVTPSGFNLTLGFYFLFIILSVGVILFGFYIQDNWVVVLGGFALVLLGLFTLFYGIDGFKDEVYTWGIGLIVIMLGAYFSIRGSMEALS